MLCTIEFIELEVQQIYSRGYTHRMIPPNGLIDKWICGGWVVLVAVGKQLWWAVILFGLQIYSLSVLSLWCANRVGQAIIIINITLNIDLRV